MTAGFIYSASDLNDYLECKRLTDLEALVAEEPLRRPDWEDEQTKLLRRKGEAHELAYLEALRRLGARTTSSRSSAARIASRRTVRPSERRSPRCGAAFARSTRQASSTAQFLGRADFLRRVERPSDLGGYSYEVVDTKLGLTREALLSRADLQLQRTSRAAAGHACRSSGTSCSETARSGAFASTTIIAYYRRLQGDVLSVRRRLQPPIRSHEARDVSVRVQALRDLRVERRSASNSRRDGRSPKPRRIDAARPNREARSGRALPASQTLAEASDDRRPTGMNPETFVKLRRQAAAPGSSDERHGEPVYELLRHDPGLGFELLPGIRTPPATSSSIWRATQSTSPAAASNISSAAGSPATRSPFRAFWGLDRDQEKRAFEEFVDFIIERRRRYPEMHVYHYANYEKAALRRLAQQHCDARSRDRRSAARRSPRRSLRRRPPRRRRSRKRATASRASNASTIWRAKPIVKKGNESIVMFEAWLVGRDQNDPRRHRALQPRRLPLDLSSARVAARTARRGRSNSSDAICRCARRRSPDEPCHAEFTRFVPEMCSSGVTRQREESHRTRPRTFAASQRAAAAHRGRVPAHGVRPAHALSARQSACLSSP